MLLIIGSNFILNYDFCKFFFNFQCKNIWREGYFIMLQNFKVFSFQIFSRPIWRCLLEDNRLKIFLRIFVKIWLEIFFHGKKNCSRNFLQLKKKFFREKCLIKILQRCGKGQNIFWRKIFKSSNFFFTKFKNFSCFFSIFSHRLKTY